MIARVPPSPTSLTRVADRCAGRTSRSLMANYVREEHRQAKGKQAPVFMKGIVIHHPR